MNCTGCNAPVNGLICEYCGAQNGKIASPTDELTAVEELKTAFVNIGKKKTNIVTGALSGALSTFGLDSKTTDIKNLIDTMWVPSSPDAALKLGLLLLSYVVKSAWGTDQSQQAISRSAMVKLDALVGQLKIEHPDASSTKKLALAYQTRLDEIASANRRLWLGLFAAIAIPTLLIVMLIKLRVFR